MGNSKKRKNSGKISEGIERLSMTTIRPRYGLKSVNGQDTAYFIQALHKKFEEVGQPGASRGLLVYFHTRIDARTFLSLANGYIDKPEVKKTAVLCHPGA